MPRMRTVQGAFKCIKESDPNTEVTPHAIRKLALTKQIPCVMVGAKRLINVEALESFLKGELPPPQDSPRGIIRMIPAR